MPPVEVGRVVGGKYELARLLGHGSMGEVWAARHLTLEETVAIKLLAPTLLNAEAECRAVTAARFRFEAQVAARLSRKSPHIVQVTDHGEEEDGLAYLVMELLEGKTLERALLMELPPRSEVTRIVGQIARALQHAHAAQVVHRDLKPANIFLACDEDGRLLVKLLDFGIARAIRTQRIRAPVSTGAGLIFGTPGYMSPEQACGARLDARTDLWALAIVAYEALTGALPHVGSTTEELMSNLLARRLVPIHERNPALPPALAEFFDIAFAQRIEQRFATASELALAFERANVTHDMAVGKTWPMPRSGCVRSDTLPLAFDARAKRGSSLPSPRVARVRAAMVAAGLLLGVAIASQGAPTSSGTGSAAAPSQSTPPAPSVEHSLNQLPTHMPPILVPQSPETVPVQARPKRSPPPSPPIPSAGPPSPTPAASSAAPLVVPARKPLDKSAVF